MSNRCIAIASGARGESGQATTEYILIVAVVVSFYLMAYNALNGKKIGQQISNAVTLPYQSVYTYGYPGAKGVDDGPPVHHPRAPAALNGAGSFRIFINPEQASGP